MRHKGVLVAEQLQDGSQAIVLRELPRQAPSDISDVLADDFKLGFFLEQLNRTIFDFEMIVVNDFGVSLVGELSLTDFLLELQDLDPERLYSYDFIRVDINLLTEVFIVNCRGVKIEILHCRVIDFRNDCIWQLCRKQMSYRWSLD